MATANFNGTSAYFAGTGLGGILGGAQTIAVLVRSGSTSGAKSMFSTFGASSGYSFSIAADRPSVYNDNAGNSTAASAITHTVLSTTDWFILVFTRGIGETPRFHDRNVTAASAWVQGDGETVQTTDPDTATAVNVGRFHFIGVGEFDFYNGDIALLGIWNGVEMTDVQVQALATNSATTDWSGHAAGAPTSLTEFNTLTPTDSRGLITWTNNGATLTGGDPTGWTFSTGGATAVGRQRSRPVSVGF